MTARVKTARDVRVETRALRTQVSAGANSFSKYRTGVIPTVGADRPELSEDSGCSRSRNKISNGRGRGLAAVSYPGFGTSWPEPRPVRPALTIPKVSGTGKPDFR